MGRSAPHGTCTAENPEPALASKFSAWQIDRVRVLRILLGIVLLVAVLAGAVLLFHERAVSLWLQHRLSTALGETWDAEVVLEEIAWRDGVLHVRRGHLTGGSLPFERITATGLRAPLPWQRLWEPGEERLAIEADTVDLILSPAEHPATPAVRQMQSPATNGNPQPALDLLASRVSILPPGGEGWSVADSSMHAVQEDRGWSIAIRGGTVNAPGLPTLMLERASAAQRDGAWEISAFAARSETGGALAGSGTQDETGWSGEVSWQDLDLAAALGPDSAGQFTGQFSGTAALKDGILRGQARVTDGVFHKVPFFVRTASLFAGENWNTIPWDVFRFNFTRHPDGRMDFDDLQALSPLGIAVRGDGHYASDSVGAELQLGLRREGRPWITAFMPVIFRGENAGYLWTKVNVRGTPEKPIEDLTPRLAAAVAAAPVAGAIEAAAEVPASAVDSAGQLLRGLFGR